MEKVNDRVSELELENEALRELVQVLKGQILVQGNVITEVHNENLQLKAAIEKLANDPLQIDGKVYYQYVDGIQC